MILRFEADFFQEYVFRAVETRYHQLLTFLIAYHVSFIHLLLSAQKLWEQRAKSIAFLVENEEFCSLIGLFSYGKKWVKKLK